MKRLIEGMFNFLLPKNPPEGKKMRRGHHRKKKNGDKYWVAQTMVKDRDPVQIIKKELHHITPDDVKKMIDKSLDSRARTYLSLKEIKKMIGVELSGLNYYECIERQRMRIGNTNAEIAVLKREIKEKWIELEEKIDGIKNIETVNDTGGFTDISIRDLIRDDTGSADPQGRRTRIHRCLEWDPKLRHAETAADLSKFTELQLLNVKNLGWKSVEIIRMELNRVGLKLRNE